MIMHNNTLKTTFLLLACITLPLSCNRPKSFTIHMMGDSTMADKDTTGGNPERGWGMVFGDCFKDNVTVMNYAKNGRSSKSFIDEGLWDSVKVHTLPGDYIFILLSPEIPLHRFKLQRNVIRLVIIIPTYRRKHLSANLKSNPIPFRLQIFSHTGLF